MLRDKLMAIEPDLTDRDVTDFGHGFCTAYKMGVAYATERAAEIADPYDRLVAAAERALNRIERDGVVTDRLVAAAECLLDRIEEDSVVLGDRWIQQRADLAAALTEIRGER